MNNTLKMDNGFIYNYTNVWYKCPVCRNETSLNNAEHRITGKKTCGRCSIERDYDELLNIWFEQEQIALYDKVGTLPEYSSQIYDDIKKCVETQNYKKLSEILTTNHAKIYTDLYCLLSGDNNVPLRDDQIKAYFDAKQQITIFDMEG